MEKHDNRISNVCEWSQSNRGTASYVYLDEKNIQKPTTADADEVVH
jgi:hypothetical protein